MFYNLLRIIRIEFLTSPLTMTGSYEDEVWDREQDSLVRSGKENYG